MPAMQLDNIRAWTDALFSSSVKCRSWGPEGTYRVHLVPQLRGATVIPSAQPEKTEHEQDDDDGTDEPND
jgi:hypothetical protein